MTVWPVNLLSQVEDAVQEPSVDNNETVMAMDVSSSSDDESEIESDQEEKEKWGVFVLKHTYHGNINEI